MTMGDILKKVKSGDPLRIPAETFNTFIDMAREYRSRQMDQEQLPLPSGRSSGIVLVKNSSGTDRSRFDVMGVSGVIFTPTDNLAEFQQRLLLTGVTPTADHTGKFVILLEPLKTDAIGSAIVSGVAVVKVNVTDASHAYADVSANQCGYLASGTTGIATILWKESGTGQKWSLVRLGGGGGSASAAPSSFPAKVVAAVSGAAYTVKEQSCTGAGTFADKSGASNLTAYNLAELSLGPGGAVDLNAIVLVMPIADTGNPPVTRYIFNHPVYAKYLS